MVNKRDFSIFDNVASVSKKSSVPARLEQLNKLAAVIPRKEIDLELKRIRNAYTRAKQNFDKANAELLEKQREVDSYQAEMNNSRQRMVDLSNQIQTMDLTSAEGVYSAKDDVFYVVDGKKYHVDCSDVSDIKMTPYKEWKVQNGSNSEDDEDFEEDNASDGSSNLIDDIFSGLDSPRYQ